MAAVSRLMWEMRSGALPAPERERGGHDVRARPRIPLHSYVDRAGHPGYPPTGSAPHATGRIRWRMTAGTCV